MREKKVKIASSAEPSCADRRARARNKGRARGDTRTPPFTHHATTDARWQTFFFFISLCFILKKGRGGTLPSGAERARAARRARSPPRCRAVRRSTCALAATRERALVRERVSCPGSHVGIFWGCFHAFFFGQKKDAPLLGLSLENVRSARDAPGRRQERFAFRSLVSRSFQAPDLDDREFKRIARSVAFQNTDRSELPNWRL